ncbi:HesA/MoeB/ThiF family protein [Zavarzinella formosa]|uniref:HesA/MoeB/ThiF family protein n=1 Tax=Zavarzinella formosa TaxID=360055 RepID=UPI0002FAE2D8|nr:ThiF family adenylyltransferase [Zavarzinella formosa]
MTIFQVGVGSGGIVVLDLVMREPTVRKIVLVEPDVYKSHNVHRHLFPPSDVGQLKVKLAAEWVRRFRPDVEVVPLAVDVTDPIHQAELYSHVAVCDLGVCAVDSESAKYHIDAMMRKHRKPWTMGEVLSGGIGGWVHRFVPGGACYGCLASHLQRAMPTDNTPPPADYADPNATRPETAIPASRASISVIASLQALTSLELVAGKEAGFSSLLLSLAVADGIFTEALRPYRFRIARTPGCLVCGVDQDDGLSGEQLDVALDQALARLAHE